MHAVHNGAHARRCLAKRQAFCGRRDHIRVQGFTAAVVEDVPTRWQMRADIPRHGAVMHIAVAGIDVDRMRGIPEGDPLAGLLSGLPGSQAWTRHLRIMSVKRLNR